MVKNLPANAGDAGLIPRSGITPVEGSGNPIQYSCLENSMDRGAWQATVYGGTESDTTATKQQQQTQNHTGSNLLCMTSLTQHNAFENRTCIYMD